MKGYFSNPELKKSTATILLISVLFLCFVLISLKINEVNLKNSYIKTIGAIADRIIEKNPSMENDIISLITREISTEEAIKGEQLLKEYGISKELENELFPYLNIIVIANNYMIITIFIIMGILLFCFNYIQYCFIYGRIRRLTLGAKKVVEGDFDISINENKEGDFSKLAVSFNSMKEVIRNNIDELKKEKQFLVNLLADISHQLKTPLSSMVVYNDIMLNSDLTKEQADTFLSNNRNQINRMIWLIQSLLKLAKLDAKAIELAKENQSLNETIEEVILNLESKAIQSDVKMNFTTTNEVLFEHDRLWLQEALINIIKNSIEHTPEGGEVKIDIVDNSLYSRITIQDTGEGISQDNLSDIFKRFFKVKTSRKSDSIGIGLALAKSIIELHNGVIHASSKLGVGTKFEITFLKY